jgi:hypothetical protein
MPLFAAWRADAPDRFGEFERVVCWSTSLYACFFLALGLNAGLVTKLLFGHAFLGYSDWLACLALLWSVRAFEGATISAFLQSTGAPFVDVGYAMLQTAVQAAVLAVMAQFGIERMLLAVIAVQSVIAVAGHFVLLGKRARMGYAAVAWKLLLPALCFHALALSLAGLERVIELVWLQPVFSMVLAGVIAVVTAWVTGYPKLLPQARTRWT